MLAIALDLLVYRAQSLSLCLSLALSQVATCQAAGITVRMVTGDNIETARAIAKVHIYTYAILLPVSLSSLVIGHLFLTPSLSSTLSLPYPRSSSFHSPSCFHPPSYFHPSSCLPSIPQTPLFPLFLCFPHSPGVRHTDGGRGVSGGPGLQEDESSPARRHHTDTAGDDSWSLHHDCMTARTLLTLTPPRSLLSRSSCRC